MKENAIPGQRPQKGPAVSIGMPVYNGAAGVGRAIASVLGQTHEDLELIVSDNGSTDGTADICAAIAARDPRVRVIRQPTNIGPTGNFKAVLAAARAPLFMWLADDDWLSRDWLARLVPLVADGRSFAFGAVQTVDDAGGLLAHRVNGRDLSFEGGALSRRLRFATDPAYLGKANPIYGLFPRAALNDDVMDVFVDSMPQSDVLLLYKVLASYPLRCDPGTILFKGAAPRAAPGPAARPVVPPARRPPRQRLFFKGTHLPELLSLSRPLEKALLLALLPLTTLRFEFQKFIPARRRAPGLPADWQPPPP